MSEYKLPFFGNINTEELEEDYEEVIDIEGVKVPVDLNFEEEAIESDRLDLLTISLNKLAFYKGQATETIKKDFQDKGVVYKYIQKHLTLKEAVLEELLANADNSVSKEEQLLSTVFLKRIGFYPETEGNGFMVMDLTISKKYTDYLIVVNHDEAGVVQEIVEES